MSDFPSLPAHRLHFDDIARIVRRSAECRAATLLNDKDSVARVQNGKTLIYSPRYIEQCRYRSLHFWLVLC